MGDRSSQPGGPLATAAPMSIPSTLELAEMIDPARSALVVIDVQQDFASPTGAMARMGADLSGVEAVLDNVETLIAAARQAGVCVAFARVVTSPQTDSTALKNFNARKGLAPSALDICREGDHGCDYYRVCPLPGDIEVSKRLFSAFHDTDFDQRLRERSVDTLILVGLTTNCCVDATARDAFHRNFNVFVVSDATAAYGEETQRQALAALAQNCGLIVETAEVQSSWSGLAANRRQPRSERPKEASRET
jgi:nicotinamidase-related amidase